MKKFAFLMFFAFALLVTLPALAQPGCDDSPENPTIVLAGLAGGAYVMSTAITRVRARRANKNRTR